MIFASNLSHYERLLQQKYDVSTSIWHKGERGRQRENGLLMFLRETLPAAYGVATGEIIPFMGRKPSPQCDIIIYDRLRIPVFGVNEAVQQVPLEGVYAVIETKSSIDAKAITDARTKFSRIKGLPHCGYRTRLRKGFRRGPVFMLFGYRLAASTEACVSLMREFSESEDVGVIALNTGLGLWIEQPPKPTTAIWLNASDAKDGWHETLALFFVTLLSSLDITDLGVPNFLDYARDT